MVKLNGLMLLAVGTAIAIVSASLLSASSKHDLHIQGFLHPWLHLSAFGLLTVLIRLAASSSALRNALVLGVIVLAFGTEFLEHLLGGNPFETIDLTTDLAGVIAGLLLVELKKWSR